MANFDYWMTSKLFYQKTFMIIIHIIFSSSFVFHETEYNMKTREEEKKTVYI